MVRYINESLPKNEREGQIGINNQGLEMVIENYRGANDIDIKFLIDGYVSKNKIYQSFLLGTIRNSNFPDPKFIDRTGERRQNNAGDWMEIIECNGAFDNTVKFDDGVIIYKVSWSNFDKGIVMNPYHSDGISIPNKMLRQIAIQLNLNWEFEYSEDWMGKKRFDAYDINLKQPIEADCFYYDNHKGNRKEVDNWKDEQAVEHDMKLTRRINLMDENKYKNNTLEYIKQQIYLAIGDLYDLDKIDWNKAFIESQKSLMIESCRLWQEECIYSTTEISNILKLCKDTVIKYLKRGYKLGLCDYTRDKAYKERGKKRSNINNNTSKLYWVIKSNGEKYSDRPLCGSEIFNNHTKGFLDITYKVFNKYIKPYNNIDINRISSIKHINKQTIEKLMPYDGWQFIPLSKEEREYLNYQQS